MCTCPIISSDSFFFSCRCEFKREKYTSSALYSRSLNRKNKRGGTIHLCPHCQGEFARRFFFFFHSFFFVRLFSLSLVFAHLLRLARWRREEYTHIHTREHADSPLSVQILGEDKSSLSSFFFFFFFFSVYIRTDANLSDEDDVDIHTHIYRDIHRRTHTHTHRVCPFRPSYDLINNSLFVHIRVQRYT